MPTLASARIQRWALILSSYSYTVLHKPGSQIPHADALSRLPQEEVTPSTIKVQKEEVFLFAEDQGPMVVTSKQDKHFTACDPDLSAVVRFTLQGWPTKLDNPSLQPYWCRRFEMSVIDNCLLWGSRVVIPPQIRESVLKELHDTHIGISRMKSLARSYVWWPSINKDMVRTCIPCQSFLKAPTAVPLHPWEWPQRSWCRLHLDYAGPFMGKMFLVVVDAHSKWLEIKMVTTATSKVTMVCLQSIFATHGLPERVVTDNGSVFTSEEFKSFLEANGIAHSTSSPYHPASNGLAERAVQSFKQSMRKATGSIESRLSRFLFTYRLTPHTTTAQSPAELLFKRRPRSRLDILVSSVELVVGRRQEYQKMSHDVHSSTCVFDVGNSVFVKDFRPGSKQWLPGKIVEILGPVSARIKLLNGEFHRRHFDHNYTYTSGTRSRLSN